MANECLVIHGGCGVIYIDEATEQACKETLAHALNDGFDVLKSGGSSIDAVLGAAKVLENSPLFNAGKGAVFNREGHIELDAGIMDGFLGTAGGVTGTTKVKNPVQLAHDVMRHTPHSLIAGSHADALGLQWGHSMVDQSYFYTERRWKQLQDFLSRNSAVPQLDHSDKPIDVGAKGTIGAVALDRAGHLAAASSTGGLTGKYAGRVSDSSIAGAGFYANKQVAVSGTGNGDFFILRQACARVAGLMELGGRSLEEAAKEVVFGSLGNCDAGIIAVDCRGNMTMPFNTKGMFRGFRNAEKAEVKIYA